MAQTLEQIRDRKRVAAVAWRAAHPGAQAARSRAWRIAHPDRSRMSQRKYEETHPEHGGERVNAWKRAHPDQVRAAKRAWAAGHRTQERERSRAWFLIHRVEVLAKVQAWVSAHPDQVRAIKARRRAAVSNAPVCDLTNTQWREIKANAGGRCHYCGEVSPLTLDHKQALSRGGSHTSKNIVAACMPCNNRKGTKSYEEYLRVVNG